MGIPLHLILGLMAAFIFAVGSMAFKRAFQEGATVNQVFIFNNLLLGVAFLPFGIWNSHPVPWEQSIRPILAGMTFFAGHWMGFMALRAGHVSLVTPLLGTKVMFVVMATTLLFGVPLRWEHLGAAILTVLGVLILSLGDWGFGRARPVTTPSSTEPTPNTKGNPPAVSDLTRSKTAESSRESKGTRSGLLRPLLLAIGCSAAFGLCDALIQEWSPEVGTGHFIWILFATLALASLVLIPFQGRTLWMGSRRLWTWMSLAVIMTACQAILITLAIAWGRDAAGVNVVYSLRGVWGLILVWLVGTWFGNRERQEAGGRALLGRLLGSLLILAAVTWILLASRTLN